MQRERPSLSKSLRVTGILFIILSFFVDRTVEFGLLGIGFFVLGTMQFKWPRK